MLRVATVVVIVLIFGVVGLLRVRGSRVMLGYYYALDNVKESILVHRLREVKTCLNELKQFRSKRCQFIEINQDMGIMMNNNQKVMEYRSLKEFSNWNGQEKDE